MGRRMMRRRGIVGAAATVSMVSTARRNRAERQAIESQMQNQQPAEEYAEAPAEDDTTVQLKKLNDLKNQGVITEEEFAKSKAKILGI